MLAQTPASVGGGGALTWWMGGQRSRVMRGPMLMPWLACSAAACTCISSTQRTLAPKPAGTAKGVSTCRFSRSVLLQPATARECIPGAAAQAAAAGRKAALHELDTRLCSAVLAFIAANVLAPDDKLFRRTDNFKAY